MIWKISTIDQAFINAWSNAGEPDQHIIDTYLERKQLRQKPMRHVGVQRWYYLLSDNPRIRLLTLGRPLVEWIGLSGKIQVGTNEIIGEFAGNRDYVGQRGLQIGLRPAEWLQGQDKTFALGSSLFEEISEQILDSRSIDRVQSDIQSRYQWEKRRNHDR
jgi:hypothetical protein